MPKLFVEAKALGHSLDDHKWESQVLWYATVAGVQWVVLTNVRLPLQPNLGTQNATQNSLRG